MRDSSFSFADAFEAPKATPEDFPRSLLLLSEIAEPLARCPLDSFLKGLFQSSSFWDSVIL